MYNKIKNAIDLISSQILTAKKPVLFCSFGKDSSVLLHLCLQIRTIPVVFIRHHKFQRQYEHAYKVARDYDLEVYDLMPSLIFDYQQDEYFDVLELYQCGPKEYLIMVDGVIKYDEDKHGSFFCAVSDLLLRPTARDIYYPWDVTLIGHKQDDPLHIADKVSDMRPVMQGKGTRTVYPILDWTDDEVWKYIKLNNVPYDKRRYDDKDDTVNPDKMPTCYNCLDSNMRGQMVHCPKVNKEIKNNGRSKDDHKKRKEAILKTISYCQPVGAGMTEAKE